MLSAPGLTEVIEAVLSRAMIVLALEKH